MIVRAATPRRAASRLFRSVTRNRDAYFFLLPMYAFLLCFLIFPALQAVYLSLFRFDVGKSLTFVGSANFLQLFGEQAFRGALGNTVLLAIVVVPLSLGIALPISVTVSNAGRFAKAYVRGAFYLPVVVSMVTLSLVWKYMYDPVIGLFNYLFSALGLPRVLWLADPRYSMMAVIIVIFSFSLGRPIILYMAAIGGIPETYYEVARMDGASRTRQFFSITLPLLKPTTLYLMVQGTINMFQTFALIQLMTGGGPNNSTQTLSFLLYQKAFVFGQYGVACAVGTILFAMVSVIALIQYKLLSTDIEY